MDVKTAVSLLLAGQGIPPEATALAYEKLEDLNELMMSAIARNRAMMIAAKVQAMETLRGIDESLAAALMAEIQDDIEAIGEEEVSETKPPEAASA